MAIIDPKLIKGIVKSNFDKSAELYKNFEDKYGLFRFLTLELAEVSNIQPGMTVCDIGCGCGTSTFILGKLIGPSGFVVGVDFSEKMLEIAKEQYNELSKQELLEISKIEFIQCDADDLEDNVNQKLDSILYNACIFLIPEPENTFKSAYDMLRISGTIGFNYLIGVYSKPVDKIRNELDLFSIAKQKGKEFAPYGRRIYDIKTLGHMLNDVGFKNIQHGRISKRMSVDELRGFYSIPAQSAALWPKNVYEERLKLLDDLIEFFLENGIEEYHQHWCWYVAEK